MQNFRMLHMEVPFHHDGGANAKSCEMPIIAGATAAAPPPRIQNEHLPRPGSARQAAKFPQISRGKNAARKM